MGDRLQEVETNTGNDDGANRHKRFLTVTLVMGVIAFLGEGALAAWCLRDMYEGSCSAALIGLWFGAPLVLLTIVSFVAELFTGRGEGPRRMLSRLVGLSLALIAFPFWLFVSGALISELGLG